MINIAKDFIVIPVRENDYLIDGISKYLKKEPGIVKWNYFADNTFNPELCSTIRKKDVYILLTLDKYPSNCLEMCYDLIDAVRRARPESITLVMPEHPGQRQDKRHNKREAISVARHAKIFQVLGVHHAISIDLHSPQIEGLYDSMDNMKGSYFFADYIKKNIGNVKNSIIISPDAGGMRSATHLSRMFSPNMDIGFIQKERIGTNKAKTGKVVGDVKGKDVILFDDIFDTGGTIFMAAEVCKKAGAKKIYACVSHALCNNRKGFHNKNNFEKSIEEKMIESCVDEFVFFNTRERITELLKEFPKLKKKVTVLNLANYLGETIKRDFSGDTLDMFKQVNVEKLYSIEHKAGGV